MATAEQDRARAEVVRLGKEWIEERIQPTLSSEHDNQFLAVDVATGDYEIDRDDYRAVKRLRDRRPTADVFLGRVGRPTAYDMRRGR